MASNCLAIKIRPRGDKKPSPSSLAHNSGMTKANYWLEDGADIVQNFKPKNHRELNTIWNEWVALSEQRYIENPYTKTRLRNTAIRIEEGLIIFGGSVNATDDEILKITKDFIKKFETDNNTLVRHFAIHSGHEGFINEDGKKILNRHVHFLFDNVDHKNGQIIRSKWKKQYLSDLQDMIFESGKTFIPTLERANDTRGQNIRGKHHRVWRKEKELENAKNTQKQQNKKKLAKQVNLNTEMKILRAELKKLKAERKDYAKLENEKKQLKKTIKKKDLSIDELNKKVKLLKKELSFKNQYIETLKQQLELSEKKNKAYFGLNINLKQEINQMKKILTDEELLNELLNKMKNQNSINNIEYTEDSLNSIMIQDDDEEDDGKNPAPTQIDMQEFFNMSKNHEPTEEDIDEFCNLVAQCDATDQELLELLEIGADKPTIEELEELFNMGEETIEEEESLSEWAAKNYKPNEDDDNDIYFNRI